MRKTLIYTTMIIFMVFALVSCKTTGSMESYQKVLTEPQSRTFEGKATLDGIAIDVIAYQEGNYIADVDIKISNKTDSSVLLNIDKSSLIVEGSSYRIVVGETKRINANLQQPTFAIAPNSSLTKTLCNPSSDSMSYGWLFFGWENPRLNLCLNINGEDVYTDIELTSDAPKISYKEEKIGEVQTNFTAWHVFFLGNEGSTAASSLLKEARKQYGENVWVQNIQYEAGWSPLSLVLFFNVYGYVQAGNATADVYHWKQVIVE